MKHGLYGLMLALCALRPAQAGPPIQVREVVPPGERFRQRSTQDLVNVLSPYVPFYAYMPFYADSRQTLDDCGNLLLHVRAEDRSRVGLYFGNPDRGWTTIGASLGDVPPDPLSLQDRLAFMSAVTDAVGRVYYVTYQESGSIAIRELREFTVNGEGQKSDRLLHRFQTSPGTTIELRANGVGEIAWFDRDSKGVMLYREGLVSRIDLGDDYSNQWVLGVHRLLDDGTVIYVLWAGDVSLLGSASTREGVPPAPLVANSFSSDDGSRWVQSFNDQGDQLSVRGLVDVSWRPDGPAATPAFEMENMEDFGFFPYIEETNVVSNAGHVIFKAYSTEPGSAGPGLYNGPDPLANRLVGVGDTLLGLTVQDPMVLDINARGEFLMAFTSLGAELPYGALPSGLLLVTLCPADLNRDNLLDFSDIQQWIDLYLEGSLRTDFTNDGLLDNGDIAEFITQFLSGC